jgi:hypothetical protein
MATRGPRCEGTTGFGHQCRRSAFWRFRVAHVCGSVGDKAWLCGSHYKIYGGVPIERADGRPVDEPLDLTTLRNKVSPPVLK